MAASASLQPPSAADYKVASFLSAVQAQEPPRSPLTLRRVLESPWGAAAATALLVAALLLLIKPSFVLRHRRNAMEAPHLDPRRLLLWSLAAGLLVLVSPAVASAVAACRQRAPRSSRA